MSLVTEAQLRGILLLAESKLSEAQAELWQTVRTEPAVWNGPEGPGGGFGVWVVARSGQEVIWLDAASGGFCAGHFDTVGQIRSPSCDVGKLGEVLGV